MTQRRNGANPRKGPIANADPAPGSARVLEMFEDEQTWVDRDQTLADADQTAADSDQTSADREQAAADSDQAASDRDLVLGGDPEAHGASRDLRTRTAQQRQYSARGRVEAAGARDQVALARDLRATERDHTAEQRDRAHTLEDSVSAGQGTELMRRAAENRATASVDRAEAAKGRARAAADRAQAARDREQAAQDGVHAHAERETLLARLATAEADGLTGTRSRATGLEDLDHEIARAHRSMVHPLVIAYVDVVGLKAVNDTHGHGAGDALLQRAVNAIRGQLRSYDLIIRIGGDEFLAVMSGATTENARQRFTAIHADLAAEDDGGEIKVGFAALEPDDSAAELIARADAELPPSSRP